MEEQNETESNICMDAIDPDGTALAPDDVAEAEMVPSEFIADDPLRSGHFGVFGLTFRQPRKGETISGRWEAKCPFHRKPGVTNCAVSSSLEGDALMHRQQLARRIGWWCCSASDFRLQRDHVRWKPTFEECPDAATVLAPKPTGRLHGLTLRPS